MDVFDDTKKPIADYEKLGKALESVKPKVGASADEVSSVKASEPEYSTYSGVTDVDDSGFGEPIETPVYDNRKNEAGEIVVSMEKLKSELEELVAAAGSADAEIEGTADGKLDESYKLELIYRKRNDFEWINTPVGLNDLFNELQVGVMYDASLNGNDLRVRYDGCNLTFFDASGVVNIRQYLPFKERVVSWLADLYVSAGDWYSTTFKDGKRKEDLAELSALIRNFVRTESSERESRIGVIVSKYGRMRANNRLPDKPKQFVYDAAIGSVPADMKLGELNDLFSDLYGRIEPIDNSS